jgi:hypothetical protein
MVLIFLRLVTRGVINARGGGSREEGGERWQQRGAVLMFITIRSGPVKSNSIIKSSVKSNPPESAGVRWRPRTITMWSDHIRLEIGYSRISRMRRELSGKRYYVLLVPPSSCLVWVDSHWE